jgi:2-haloacid dehalogenase
VSSPSPHALATTRGAPRVIAFDLYGTLVDPRATVGPLATLFGERAEEAASLWREKQIEFSFRRALMRAYVDFSVCTAQALLHVSDRMGVHLDEPAKRILLDAYRRLPAFPDVTAALQSLTAAGHTLVVLTNATEQSARALLHHAELIRFFETIITVDTIQTFKPNPAVYELLVNCVQQPKEKVWLVSANPWDVIGARAFGMKSAWVQRDPSHHFDPWEWAPDVTVANLGQLCDRLPPQ